MVTLEVRQEVAAIKQMQDNEIARQVAEITEAAELAEEPIEEPTPVAPAWKFSMPFAGVRYFSYD